MVYRTLQNGKRLREKHVGPLFTTREEAMRAVEHFVETEHDAEPNGWVNAGDRGVKLIPDGSDSVFYVTGVKVRESLDELIDEEDVDDGAEGVAV